MEPDHKEPQSLSWWIASLAVSIVVCAVFAGYVFNIKEDLAIAKIRADVMDQRLSVMTLQMENLNRRMGLMQIQTGSAVPATTVLTPTVATPAAGTPAEAPAATAPAVAPVTAPAVSPEPAATPPAAPTVPAAPAVVPTTPIIQPPALTAPAAPASMPTPAPAAPVKP